MKRLKTWLQFIGWPTVTGVLCALVIVQYQQLQRFQQLPAVLQSNENSIIALPQTESPPNPSQQTTAVATIPFSDAIGAAAPSVVSITATSVNVEGGDLPNQRFRLGERSSLGSGVIISEKGYILTNLHVVDTLADFDTTVTLTDGRSVPGTVIALDKENDLALLHINMKDLPHIQLGDDKDLKVGDIVFAIGYPRNIGQSVSQGIISAIGIKHRRNSEDYLIQTDAAINPGNSGGALINRSGKLVGINSAIYSESGSFEGIGFATPVSIAVRIMDRLIKETIASSTGYLGVTTGEALNDQSSELFFGVPDIRGMLVQNAQSGGPAELAGVLPGDVITKVEDKLVLSEQDALQKIQTTKPGDTINVEVYRNGQTLSIPITLGFGQSLIVEP